MKLIKTIKILSFLMVIALILGLTFTSSPFTDIRGHWAK